jgi:hypothetical protein
VENLHDKAEFVRNSGKRIYITRYKPGKRSRNAHISNNFDKLGWGKKAENLRGHKV